MKFHLVLQSIRNAKSYIQNRSPTAKQIKIRQKILHESLKIGRTNATAAREGQIQTKYNKFGLKLTNKQGSGNFSYTFFLQFQKNFELVKKVEKIIF